METLDHFPSLPLLGGPRAKEDQLMATVRVNLHPHQRTRQRQIHQHNAQERARAPSARSRTGRVRFTNWEQRVEPCPRNCIVSMREAVLDHGTSCRHLGCDWDGSCPLGDGGLPMTRLSTLKKNESSASSQKDVREGLSFLNNRSGRTMSRNEQCRIPRHHAGKFVNN
ncbi:uncharacterized protein LY79DRAFT_571585 [Colletotrichum navitas]|uniref:Uncharacterized protein n=1 Tax=Colletotrichum navitas TaxID=681940 RepID=A0AAD8PLI9_9PEZI|nr:uncharacterized protein LY79DRAFT_571585 [Colletotrichum navitas]KAK1569617.1 hypothetical protein LY79DRAFT_571585 [Colletotrichum navitas]